MSKQIRLMQKFLREENKKYGNTFQRLEASNSGGIPMESAWRNSRFLVQIFFPEDGAQRMTISRSMIDESGDWVDGITWDEIQTIKRELGFADRWAVEIFPSDKELVCIHNMRHIWLLPEMPKFAWSNKKGSQAQQKSAE